MHSSPPARDDGRLAGDDALRRERNRLQARAAEAVHRHARYGDRQARADRRLPGDVLAGGALRQRAAEDDVFDFGRLDAGPLHRMLDHMAAEIGAMGHVERAAIGFADRGAGGGHNDGVGHWRSPFLAEHDPTGKPASTFPDHALFLLRTGNALSGHHLCRRIDWPVKPDGNHK